MAKKKSSAHQDKLERYLILNKFFLYLFGCKSFKDIRGKIDVFKKDSWVNYSDIFLRFEHLNFLSKEQLSDYCKRVENHITKFNRKRIDADKIEFLYFQFLAILFTEIYLDKYFFEKQNFLNELNNFYNDYNRNNNSFLSNKVNFFNLDELNKLAFWMATGSGKTLIMHINYEQIKYYIEKSTNTNIANYILITPSPGLSEQHKNELEKSGYKDVILYEKGFNVSSLGNDKILIINIQKLLSSGKKKITLDEKSQRVINAFSNKNVLFIDEGHKGQGEVEDEKVWKTIRENLGSKGFIFEYSATFEQVININNKKRKSKDYEETSSLLDTYAKTILSDYNYRYFYNDGYGKDHKIFNTDTSKNYTNVMLTANLLSFYTQKKYFMEFEKDAKDFRLKNPLWAFVGSKVIKEIENDVKKILDYIKLIFNDKNKFLDLCNLILNGKSGMKYKGIDIFKDTFSYFNGPINQIKVNDILKTVFYSTDGDLKVYSINSPGEFALKIDNAIKDKYFGLIYVGDDSSFSKYLRKNKFSVDNMGTESLFKQIDNADSTINLLIGAKKFIEGWNAYRVSSLGLMNIGKSKGAQIIQLFGRGIRLEGKRKDLKRYIENDKEHITALQTLNIFGIKSNYMEDFLKSLKEEIDNYYEFKFPLKFSRPNKWQNSLFTVDNEKNLKEKFVNGIYKLSYDEKIKILLDLHPKVSRFVGEELEFNYSESEEYNLNHNKIKFYDKYKVIIELLNFNDIYYEIINYKNERGYFNLIIDKNVIKEIIVKDAYIIDFEESQFNINDFIVFEQLKDAIVKILKIYIDKYMSQKNRVFISENQKICYLDKTNGNLDFVNEKGNNGYLKIIDNNNTKDLIKEIKSLLTNISNLNKDNEKLRNVYFDKHLYNPLFYKRKRDSIQDYYTNPPALNDGEIDFVLYLKKYLNENHNEFKNKELFLLRNNPHSGVGFYIKETDRTFYPDFIMWIKENRKKQKIIFIDPKGVLIYPKRKIDMLKNIKIFENLVIENSKNWFKNKFEFYGFIFSVTSYNEFINSHNNLGYETYANEDKILFLYDEKENSVKRMFEQINN